MALEIELKLSLPQSAQLTLCEHPLLQKYSGSGSRLRELSNLYYDTPDQALNRHRVALRIRRQDDRLIQTLKTRGESRGGLHQRQEWEWDIPEPLLQPELLPTGALPTEVDTGKLSPAFSTDFKRRVWLLDYPFREGLAKIELVLDDGFATTGGTDAEQPGVVPRRDAISEIELELLEGEPEALFALALELAKDIPLRITRTSKAERGYRLLDPARVQVRPLSKDHFQDSDGPALLAVALELLQERIESFEYLQDPLLLPEIVAVLDLLMALVAEPTLKVEAADRGAISDTAISLRSLAAPWLLEAGTGTRLFSADERSCRQRRCAEALNGRSFSTGLLKLSLLSLQLQVNQQ